MQPFAILFGAGFTVLSGWALGGLLLGPSMRDPGVRFVAGSALLSLLVFGLCSVGAAGPWRFALGGAAVIAAGWRSMYWPAIPKINRPFVVVFGVFFLLYFFNAMAPEISFDGSRYHLGLVGRYLREGGFHPITDNLYAALSQGVEMLYLFAYAFGRHSAASMVHFAFLLALVWQIFHYAEAAGFRFAGMAAALLVFASPAVGVVAASAYVDVAVAVIAFTLFRLLQAWDGRRQTRLLVAAGLVAGFAFAAKYTAWVAVPYAVLWVGWRSRSLRRAALVAFCAAAMALPWLARNWIIYRNPVAPFFNQQFPNPYFTVSFEREYRNQMAHYGLPGRREIPMQVTTYGSLGGLLGPIFLMSPLALLALRSREGRQLLLAALVFGANYFSNIGTRFLIPSLPFVALAFALGLSAWPRILIGAVMLHAVLSWPSVVRLYAHPDAWFLSKVPYREALRIKPEDGYLASNLPLYRTARLLDQATPPGASIFTFTPIPEAYTERHVKVAYQSAENVVSRGVFWGGFSPEHAPRLRLRFHFARQPISGFRLVETASGSGVWSISELRVFDGSEELANRGAWRLSASPFPWGIERVVDGRPLSFWRCGDTLRPGQTVTAGLGRVAEADTVVVEAAPNQPELRLRLELEAAAGTWISAGAPELAEAPPGNFRRAAAAELKRRGIDYLLIFDGEFGAEDVREHAAEWGVRQVGEAQGGRLYQLP